MDIERMKVCVCVLPTDLSKFERTDSDAKDLRKGERMQN